MISALESKKCCGCTACKEICPVFAINMKSDIEGFSYPFVETDKCIDCGLCEKVCPAIAQPEFNNEPRAYAVQLKDDETLDKSQSGGGYWVVAKKILEEGGIVYGAGYDGNLKVVHKRAETIEQAHEFHGSKYVQSDIDGILKKVKEDLNNGKKVLFSGTACHIAGLYKFLGKEYDNLVTCDLICHGVPTPLLFKKYVEYIEKREKNTVKSFHFGYYNAEKGYTWNHPRREMIVFDNDKSLQSKEYISMFASNWCLRPYCHTCPYTKPERVADFTIGDCWGAEKYTHNFNYDKGVSVVFVNNEKATMFFEGVKDSIICEEVDIENVKKHQHNLHSPSVANKRREKILKTLIEKDFKSAYKMDRFYYNLYCLKQKVLRK